jgi:hypothetical protein
LLWRSWISGAPLRVEKRYALHRIWDTRRSIMPNLHRGEIEADIGGARRRLVLTLGALAELEAAFGADDLVALAERFGGGRLKARDLVRIIADGLRGAAVSDEEVAAMTVAGGAEGYVRIAGALIAATFGAGEAAPSPQLPQAI